MPSIARKALTAAALGAAALAASAAPADITATQMPTVVLVHGAFADGSSWDPVIALLQARGLKVVAVQNPLTSLTQDVATTLRALRRESAPVVLVGHSYGGVVITEAGQQDNVKALVYVAAYAPSEKQSIADLNKAYPTPSGFSHIVADNEGFLTLTPEGVSQHLAQDVPAPQARLIAAKQAPTQGRNFEDKVSIAAWKTKPSWYIVSEQDRMLQPDLQRAMARTLQAKVVSLSSSHAPHLSRPGDVAAVIVEAVQAVKVVQADSR